MKHLQWVILSLSALTFALALSSLIFPLGHVFQGDARISSALSTAMALTVASLGVVLAVYMQSAEYRRRTEIIDGLQELRAILELMKGRYIVIAGNQKQAESMAALNMEKQKFLNVVVGPAGLFLNLYKTTKDAAASNKGETWRALPVHLATIMEADSTKDCIGSIAALQTLLKDLDSKSIGPTAKLAVTEKALGALKQGRLAGATKAKLAVSEKALGVLKEDILVKSTKSLLESASQTPEIPKADIERLYSELAAKMNETDQGKKALAELDDTIEKARRGDNKAAQYIALLHEALVG